MSEFANYAAVGYIITIGIVIVAIVGAFIWTIIDDFINGK